MRLSSTRAPVFFSLSLVGFGLLMAPFVSGCSLYAATSSALRAQCNANVSFCFMFLLFLARRVERGTPLYYFCSFFFPFFGATGWNRNSENMCFFYFGRKRLKKHSEKTDDARPKRELRKYYYPELLPNAKNLTNIASERLARVRFGLDLSQIRLDN